MCTYTEAPTAQGCCPRYLFHEMCDAPERLVIGEVEKVGHVQAILGGGEGLSDVSHSTRGMRRNQQRELPLSARPVLPCVRAPRSVRPLTRVSLLAE